MSVAVIINPLAGAGGVAKGRQRAEWALRVLLATGEDPDISVTDHRGHARELAAAAVKRGARLVIAWGGDGTVNEVGSALAFGPTALGIVPAGSGNGLARTLHVDRRPERAIREALAAAPRPIDAGELGGRLFFSVAGVGFDAHVASCFDRDRVGRRGLATYARLVVRELSRYRCLDYRLDHVDLKRVVLITFANSGQFGNGARIAPGARLDDGWLDVVVLEETSRPATMMAMCRLFIGGLSRVRGLSTARIRHATIEAERPLLFHVDGEPMEGDARLEARVHPSALHVCVR